VHPHDYLIARISDVNASYFLAVSCHEFKVKFCSALFNFAHFYSITVLIYNKKSKLMEGFELKYVYKFKFVLEPSQLWGFNIENNRLKFS